MDAPAISALSLRKSLASVRPPLVFDVRRQPTILDAAERQAVPYDIADVEFTREGDDCSFDAFITRYRRCKKGKSETHTWNPEACT